MKKVILVAGGSRGIGEFLASSFFPDYNVSVCSREIHEERNAEGFFAMKCDLRKQDDIHDFVTATMAKFGRIDTVIYSAGLMLYDNIIDIKEDDLAIMYEAMIRGYLLLCREIIPTMREQGYGHIINIGSIRGLTVTPNKSVYSALKRQAISITESIQVENEQYGIKATSIHPDTVDTASSRKRYDGKFNHLNLVKHKDILKSINFVLSLSPNVSVDSIFLRGIHD